MYSKFAQLSLFAVKKRFAMPGFPLYNRERTCLPITIAKIT